MKRVESELDRILRVNVANGWEANRAEIRPASDGFELVVLTAMISGAPAWRREAFCRTREGCVEAAKLRGLTVE